MASLQCGGAVDPPPAPHCRIPTTWVGHPLPRASCMLAQAFGAEIPVFRRCLFPFAESGER